MDCEFLLCLKVNALNPRAAALKTEQDFKQEVRAVGSIELFAVQRALLGTVFLRRLQTD
jgi:hypothetical protein